MSENISSRVGRLSITVLVDNVSHREDLRSEAAFSAWLETERGVLLFDVAETAEAVIDNARALNIDLAAANAIAISHGHHDHTGGLAGVLAAAPNATLYVHPATSAPKWHGRRRRNIGMSEENVASLAGREVIHVEKPMTTPQGLILSGSIPGPESPAERGFDAEVDGERGPDRFVDEMFVLADTATGVVLITGCCHRGLVNTLNHAKTISGGKPIATVLGGLHMARLTDAEMDATIAALQSAGTETLIAGHCTGDNAVAYLVEHASFRVETFHAGFTRTW